MIEVVADNAQDGSPTEAWRRPVAERLRLIASQIESGNVSSVVCVSKCGDLWVQDIRYDDQYEAVGALEQTKLTLLMGRTS